MVNFPSPGGPIPHDHGVDRFGPPTLERSGSERRGGAVTSLALLERARAWEWVKDPPAGEGQVGHKQYRVGRLHTNRCLQRKRIREIRVGD